MGGRARARLVAEFARRRPGDEPTAVATDRVLPGSRWAPDELGLALERTRLSAKSLIGQSLRLTHLLPDTLAALQAGTIDEQRADAICQATLPLPVDKARRVEAVVLPAAAGKTVRQLRDRLRTAVHRVDPDGERRRHQAARLDRRVTIQAREEGMASLWISASAADAEASFTMLTRLAKTLGPEDPRSLDQRRSDLAVQQLQGRLTLTDLGDLTAAIRPGDAVTGDAVTGDAATGDAATGDDRECNDTGADGSDRRDAAGGTATARGAPHETGAPSGYTQGERSEPAQPPPAEPSPAQPPAAQPPTERPPTEPPPTEPPPTEPPPGSEPSGPEPSGPVLSEQVLLDAVTAALARRPQVCETIQRPLVHVVVGLDTLTGDSERPAHLAGHGPVTAATARALAAGGVWARLVTDPVSGALLDHGRRTYRPPAAVADHIDARDHTCRFPTCTRRATDGDHDHHRRYEHGGTTSADNLHAYCPHHHLLKEHRDWHVLAHPDGRITWVTPTGRRHTSDPHDYRPFTDPLDQDDGGTDIGTGGVPEHGPDPSATPPGQSRPESDDDRPPF